jgi:hypothetical protein
MTVWGVRQKRQKMKVIINIFDYLNEKGSFFLAVSGHSAFIRENLMNSDISPISDPYFYEEDSVSVVSIPHFTYFSPAELLFLTFHATYSPPANRKRRKINTILLSTFLPIRVFVRILKIHVHSQIVKFRWYEVKPQNDRIFYLLLGRSFLNMSSLFFLRLFFLVNVMFSFVLLSI